MYKLVAIDCDNTLLDSTAHIPQENINIISKLKNKGIDFIIATGRNDILVKDYVDELGIAAPVIGCNGGSIRNLSTNELYSFSPITKTCLKAVFDYCDERNINIKAFSMTHGYTNDGQTSLATIGHIIKTYTKVLKSELIYENREDMSSLIDEDELLKLVIVDNNPEFIEKTQGDLLQIEGIEVVRSNSCCLDIMNKGCTKGAAVMEYAKGRGIKPEEIIAFGDSENDYSMLKMAGYAVAMGNGESILKEIADMVTLTNDEAGVAYALRKLFEGELI